MISIQQTQTVGGSSPWIVSPVFVGLCNHIDQEVDVWVVAGWTGCNYQVYNTQWHMF